MLVHLMKEPGFSIEYEKVAVEAMRDLLREVGWEKRVIVKGCGAWRSSQWKRNGRLVPHESVDYYLQIGKKSGERWGMLDATEILEEFIKEPLRRTLPHWDFLLLKQKFYSRDHGQDLVGLTGYSSGSIVSIFRFDGLPHRDFVECLKTLVMHEFGHVLGLPSGRRAPSTVVEALGLHCRNVCVMRQGLSVPYDWLEMSRDRIRAGRILCDDCRFDLKGARVSDRNRVRVRKKVNPRVNRVRVRRR